jgi:molybdopterin molybdotransferase
MLLSMLKRLGMQTMDMGIIPDDPDLITQAFNYANQHADCVITCGGVSVGDTDYTRQVLQQLGDIDFWKLAIKPGKPLAVGRLSDCVFFGLPGNPVSAAVTFEQIAAPSLLLMAGSMPERFFSVTATASKPFRKRPGRTDFQRALCYKDEQGNLKAEPVGKQSSGVLSCFSHSNCYAVLERERGNIEIGENITIQLFDRVMT